MRVKRLEIVVGAQYGSEAKGHVTARLLDHRRKLDLVRNQGYAGPPWVNTRVAGPNAGHTAYDSTGRAWALRSVPVGATRPYPVTLVIAPGSEVDLQVLVDEVEALNEAGLLHNKTLYVDPNATLITDAHKEAERTHELVRTIGSTGKGIGAARANRIMRQAHRLVDNTLAVERIRALPNVNFTPYQYSPNDRVIIEGTQGYGLGMHGIHYPKCTSSDCRAIDFCAMAGISPWNTPLLVWAVARMYPIRVAGNSGYLKDETSWEELGLPEERTTVTKKVRRVGLWDDELVRDAIYANGGGAHVQLALTMVDQRWPNLAGAESWTDIISILKADGLGIYDADQLPGFMQALSDRTRTQVGMITTGPTTGMVI